MATAEAEGTGGPALEAVAEIPEMTPVPGLLATAAGLTDPGARSDDRVWVSGTVVRRRKRFNTRWFADVLVPAAAPTARPLLVFVTLRLEDWADGGPDAGSDVGATGSGSTYSRTREAVRCGDTVAVNGYPHEAGANTRPFRSLTRRPRARFRSQPS